MTTATRVLTRTAFVLWIINEIRGAVLAAPVLWGLFQVNTVMAVWTSLCMLGGIALSVIVPAWALQRLNHKTYQDT